MQNEFNVNKTLFSYLPLQNSFEILWCVCAHTCVCDNFVSIITIIIAIVIIIVDYKG